MAKSRFLAPGLEFENSSDPFLQLFLKEDELIPALDVTL